jgi:UDP-2-acetamido-3-amino-2,3-dideoxy-glucuronate N-acetyltransferase
MSMSLPPSLSIAVVGAGYWGKNLIRNFNALGHLHTICDTRPELLADFQTQYPQVQIENSFDALLQNPAVDAVVLATPSLTHYPLGTQVLNAGKHLYVEKPLATTLKDAQALVDLAKIKQKTLMVGHLLMYHPAMNRMKQILDSGALGELRYIQSDRLNYNHGRHDRNVFWDLAPHDLSVLIYLMDGEVPEVTGVLAQRVSPKDDKVDWVEASFAFKNGVKAHLQNSWISPKKQVQQWLVGTQGALVLDDTLPLAERLSLVRFDDAGKAHHEAVEYLPLEPLRLECQHFINAVTGGWQPQSDDRNGLAVVQVLEAVQAHLERA